MELSIIFVNWNSVAYLRECIGSVYTHTSGVEFEIIVVDNASPQRDVETLHDLFPAVRILLSSQNLGFAGANNLGFRNSTGDYLLFLNPDTRLITPAINRMLESARSLLDAGIVGCKLLNSDRSIQTESIQRFPTILNQLLDVESLRLRWPACPLWRIDPLFRDADAPVRVEVIPGACQLIRRDVFAAAGLYTEDYFMYAEDIDLNFKVARLGLGSYYVGSGAIIHHGGRSSNQHGVSQWSTRMIFRAKVMFYRKTRGRMYAGLYQTAMALVAVGRLVLLGLMSPGQSPRKKERIRQASAKWWTVLKCAAGFANPA
ncbi:MAG TPA: glycosyltransferase family 2 protein [Bryobacteraceae bacterium]|nr:glycosyltransferase family 2 protein [Bryobacteraceae bacterium]